MSWNYRILKHTNKENGNVLYGLYEVYYDQFDLPNGCTENAIDLYGFETVSDLIKTLEMMLKDAKKYKNKILNYEDF